MSLNMGILQAETSVVFREYYTEYLPNPDSPCVDDENYNFKVCVDKAVGWNKNLLRMVYDHPYKYINKCQLISKKTPCTFLQNCYFQFLFNRTFQDPWNVNPHLPYPASTSPAEILEFYKEMDLTYRAIINISVS